MAILKYGQLYNQYGVRTSEKLKSPTLKLIGGFNLPKFSVLHYLSDDQQFGPTNTPLIKDGRPTSMYHVFELKESKGFPRILRKPINAAITDYRKEYPRRKTRLDLAQLSKVTNPDELIVFNYNPLFQWAEYRDNPLRDYYRWYNAAATYWQTIKTAIVDMPNHQHFVFYEIPEIVPKREILKTVAKSGIGNLNKSTNERLGSDAIKDLYVLWEWIGSDRSNSLLKDFTATELMRLNVVFTQNGRMAVLNLGLLDSWRKQTVVDEDGNESKVGTKQPEQLQLSFLLMLHSIRQGEAELDILDEDGEVVVLESATVVNDRIKQLGQIVDRDRIRADIEKTLGDLGVKTTPTKTEAETSNAFKDTDENSKDTFDLDTLTHVEEEETDDDTDDALFETLAKEVEQYEEVEPEAKPSMLPQTELALDPYVPQDTTPTTVIERLSASLVKSGVISPQLQNVIEEVSHSYESIVAPGSDLSIKEYVNVTEQETKVVTTKLPDIATVLDKNMLQTTLIGNNERYINHVLPKHVLACILAIQGSGCSILNIVRSETRTLLNEYDTYSVKIMTLAGKEETKQIRVPHVREDGTMIVGGVDYYLKQLRTDIPIRKVNPSRVALTSYYGKLFIERSERVAFNYPRWIKNSLFNLVGVSNPAGVTLISMHGNNVFDNDGKYPRVFGILAQFIQSVKFTIGDRPELGEISFSLDYAASKSNDPKAFDGLEATGLWYIGKTSTGYQVVVNEANQFIAIKGSDSVINLGSIESVFDLPLGKRPLEMATMGIFGKNVPIGVVLGVQVGWDRLLATLKPEYRVVDAGTRISAGEDEFVVPFKNRTYVFKRGNKQHELIYSGFMALSNETRKYPHTLFNESAVYGNVMQEVGVPARVINEIGLLYDMFIDPITMDVLKYIKEPTNFYGLLIRAVELLEVEQHPYETDITAQLIKGHERIAGAIYSEVVRGARLMRSKTINTRVGLELNPDGAWLSIMQDPSKEVVNDINPIHNLKQKELVTYSGTGGRSKETMVKRTRVFRESDIGIISEAGVDSSAVGIITYLTANPNITTTYGTTEQTSERDNIPKMLSTAAVLSPGAEHDD